MNKEEALEMLKSLKFNWTIDLNKIPEMFDYFFNIQSQLDIANNKLDKIKKIATKRLKHNQDYIKTESEDANLLYILSIIGDE